MTYYTMETASVLKENKVGSECFLYKIGCMVSVKFQWQLCLSTEKSCYNQNLRVKEKLQL